MASVDPILYQDQLLPCPFCGGDKIEMTEGLYWTGQSYNVISVSIRHWCKNDGMMSHTEMKAKTHEHAIKLWNTRNERS